VDISVPIDTVGDYSKVQLVNAVLPTNSTPHHQPSRSLWCSTRGEWHHRARQTNARRRWILHIENRFCQENWCSC